MADCIWTNSESCLKDRQTEQTGVDVTYVVGASIDRLTRGCESCLYSSGLYCERTGQPVYKDGTRCEYFVRRLPMPSEGPSDGLSRCVNKMLGIKEPRKVKRLTGVNRPGSYYLE